LKKSKDTHEEKSKDTHEEIRRKSKVRTPTTFRKKLEKNRRGQVKAKTPMKIKAKNKSEDTHVVF